MDQTLGLLAFACHARDFRQETPFPAVSNKDTRSKQLETDLTWSEPDFRARATMALESTINLLSSSTRAPEISQQSLAVPTTVLSAGAAAEGRNYGLGGLVRRHDKRAQYLQKRGRIAELPEWSEQENPSAMTYELLAVLMRLQGRGRKNEKIITRVDSAGAVYSCARGANSNSTLDSAIAAAICQQRRRNNIKAHFARISTKRNPADPVSRLRTIREYFRGKKLARQQNPGQDNFLDLMEKWTKTLNRVRRAQDKFNPTSSNRQGRGERSRTEIVTLPAEKSTRGILCLAAAEPRGKPQGQAKELAGSP